MKLCRSSVPGAEFGVCAAHPIPPGTWIGPYEGQVVRRDELREGAHNNYMWEVGKMSAVRIQLIGKNNENKFTHKKRLCHTILSTGHRIN